MVLCAAYAPAYGPSAVSASASVVPGSGSNSPDISSARSISDSGRNADCVGVLTSGMEFDLTKTAAVFVAIVAAGVAALVAAPMMGTQTVLMMVAPSMLVFGLVMVALGVKHGEYRATR